MPCNVGPTPGSVAQQCLPQGSQRSWEPLAEVSHLVEILVACFARAFVAPTSGSLVESFPLPACVDPPGILH